MNSNSDKKTETPELSENQVLDYLESNPDFFNRNEEALSRVVLQHNSGDAASIIERQIKSLRNRNQKIENQLSEMVSVAKINEEIFHKIRSLCTGMIDIETWQQLNETLATHFLTNFKADYILCNYKIEESAPSLSLDHIKFEEIKIRESFKTKTEPVCLQLREDEMHKLFGSTYKKGNETESALIIPFRSKNVKGFLSVGSTDPLRFNNNMETMFASFISSLLGRVVYKLCK